MCGSFVGCGLLQTSSFVRRFAASKFCAAAIERITPARVAADDDTSREATHPCKFADGSVSV
jgi:hypothetical protein